MTLKATGRFACEIRHQLVNDDQDIVADCNGMSIENQGTCPLVVEIEGIGYTLQQGMYRAYFHDKEVINRTRFSLRFSGSGTKAALVAREYIYPEIGQAK